MKGKNLQHTLLSSFGGIRYFAVLGNEMISEYQREPPFQSSDRGSPAGHPRVLQRC